MRIMFKSDFEPSYDPVFSNNSWATIKRACQSGNIPSTWLVGDTKEMVGADGNTYTIRLVDKQSGRYTYSNDITKTTNAVFEFVELIPQTTRYNASNTNEGGFADSLLRKNLNGLTDCTYDYMTNVIPTELRDLLEFINVTTADGGGESYTGMTSSANKLFVGCMVNIISIAIQRYIDEDTKGQFDYYKSGLRVRAKALVTDPTEYKAYWLASPYYNGDRACGIINTDSSATMNEFASFNYSVAPCWAW